MAGGRRGGQGGRGAKEGSHRKGASRGSGGKGRKALRGKGPTPPAQQRYAHPAAKRAVTRGSAVTQPTREQGAARVAETDEYVIGRNSVVEAVRAGVPGSALYAGDYLGADDRVEEAIREASDAGVPVHSAGRTELDRFTRGGQHQGLALRVAPYDYAHPDDMLTRAYDTAKPPLFVALDGVRDPHNLGAIARSAAAFGAHGVLVPRRRAAHVTAGAWKSSAGALARIPVARVPNLARALTSYQAEGLFVIGLAGSGEVSLRESELATDPLVVVVGSEGAGLSRIVGESCDERARVPLATGMESLNVSVAAGVALYEVARRRVE